MIVLQSKKLVAILSFRYLARPSCYNERRWCDAVAIEEPKTVNLTKYLKLSDELNSTKHKSYLRRYLN